MGRTKGKWKQNGSNGVHTEEGNCIALTYRNCKSDAEFICLAVNNHDKLVEALQGMIDRCEESEIFTATQPYFKAKQVLEELTLNQ